MKTENLSLDLLRIDGDTQSRLAINEDAVGDYCELIQDAGGQWPFPPLDVFFDGSEYFVADGFHRKLGAVRAKRSSVPCNVHEGTATDARIFGMTANDRNGLRMTRADKRACVCWFLDNGGKMKQQEIAEKAGVSARWVRQIVADRNADSLKGKMASGGTKASPPKATGTTSGCVGGHVSPDTPDRGGKSDETTTTSDPVDFPDEPVDNLEDEDREPTDDEIRAAASSKSAPAGKASSKPKDEPEPSELAKKNKTLAHSYRDKLARAICDYHEVCPNRSERDRLVKLVQGVQLW